MLVYLRIGGKTISILTNSRETLTRKVVANNTKVTHYFRLFYLFGQLSALQWTSHSSAVQSAIKTSLRHEHRSTGSRLPLSYHGAVNVNGILRCHPKFFNLFLVNLFLDLVEEFTGPLDDDSEELSALDLLRPYLDATIPNTNDQNNVLDFHSL